jgi:hypothetical protein
MRSKTTREQEQGFCRKGERERVEQIARELGSIFTGVLTTERLLIYRDNEGRNRAPCSLGIEKRKLNSGVRVDYAGKNIFSATFPHESMPVHLLHSPRVWP